LHVCCREARQRESAELGPDHLACFACA
jgi:hypothetical protein